MQDCACACSATQYKRVCVCVCSATQCKMRACACSATQYKRVCVCVCAALHNARCVRVRAAHTMQVAKCSFRFRGMSMHVAFSQRAACSHQQPQDACVERYTACAMRCGEFFNNSCNSVQPHAVVVYGCAVAECMVNGHSHPPPPPIRPSRTTRGIRQEAPSCPHRWREDRSKNSEVVSISDVTRLGTWNLELGIERLCTAARRLLACPGVSGSGGPGPSRCQVVTATTLGVDVLSTRWI
jgi:hypothetical protein